MFTVAPIPSINESARTVRANLFDKCLISSLSSVILCRIATVPLISSALSKLTLHQCKSLSTRYAEHTEDTEILVFLRSGKSMDRGGALPGAGGAYDVLH